MKRNLGLIGVVKRIIDTILCDSLVSRDRQGYLFLTSICISIAKQYANTISAYFTLQIFHLALMSC